MKDRFKSQKLNALLPYFVLAFAVLVSYKIINEIGFFANILGQIWSVAKPFFYGFILAYILNIPCGGIRKLLVKTNRPFIIKRKKGLSILSVFLIFALFLGLILHLIIP